MTPLDLVRKRFPQLSPELGRAARWLADHPADVGVMSMRQQARAIGVSPPTMSRLARSDRQMTARGAYWRASPTWRIR